MPPKKKSLKGGSTASDAVIKHVPDTAFEQMNRQFTNDFAISGGARRSIKRAAPRIDLNAAPSMKMVIRNKKGGANTYHASIGKPEVPPYKIPESLPSPSGNNILPSVLTSWTQTAQTVPYPQLELAARDTSSLTSVSGNGPPQIGAGKYKSKAKAKPKAKETRAKPKTAKSKL